MNGRRNIFTAVHTLITLLSLTNLVKKLTLKTT